MPTIDKSVGRTTVASNSREQQFPKRRRNNEAIPQRYRNRPYAIRTAIYKVWENSEELGLTKATTSVLQAILAAGVRSDSPFNPIFARKETIAKMANCSEVTVYRAMKQLEKAGWIKRSTQERLEDGSLHIGLLTITHKLASLTGLAPNDHKQEHLTNSSNSDNSHLEISKDFINSQEKIDRYPENSGQSQSELKKDIRKTTTSVDRTEMKDGLKGGYIYKGEQVCEPKASVNYQSTRTNFVRIDGRSVAQELVWLITEKRLTLGGLFELQTLAKKVPGQQLSDFVAYRSERIKQLSTTGDCYRYLRKLISDGLDARFLCAQRAKQEHRILRRHQRDEAAAHRDAWCRARHENVFINPKTGISYKVNANYGLLEVRENGAPSKKPNITISSKFIRAVEEGTLIKQLSQTPTLCREHSQRKLDELTSALPWIRSRRK